VSEQFAWPKKGNKAFVSGAEGSAFHLSSHYSSYSQKAEAFKIAAVMVIDQCQDADWQSYRDELFFPVAYLYRHCLELRMKDIISTGVGMHFFNRNDVSDAMEGHNLAKLWNHAKKLLIDRWPSADQTPLRAVEAVVNECHQADPNGQVFRYDTDKHGRRHRHETLPEDISLAELRKTMDGVFNFLDATASELQDNLSDMIATMREYRD
jgi:hypothetical protein